MNSITNIKKLLGKKGFSGPIFILDKNNLIKFDADDGLPLVAINKRTGIAETGFYSVQANINDSKFSAEIIISGYLSKKHFLVNTHKPETEFTFYVDDTNQVLNPDGSLLTAGTFSTYFAKDVVKTNGNREQWKAIDLVLSLDGTAPFQRHFPVSFAADKGFSAQGNNGEITQNNINNALA